MFGWILVGGGGKKGAKKALGATRWHRVPEEEERGRAARKAGQVREALADVCPRWGCERIRCEISPGDLELQKREAQIGVFIGQEFASARLGVFFFLLGVCFLNPGALKTKYLAVLASFPI